MIPTPRTDAAVNAAYASEPAKHIPVMRDAMQATENDLTDAKALLVETSASLEWLVAGGYQAPKQLRDRINVFLRNTK